MTGTVVLLHGFTGAPECWGSVEALLPRDRRVVRPALLGHGAPAEGVSTFEEEVDRIASELRAEDVREAALCGYSLGARLGLGLLLRHGDLFVRAVLVGAQPGLASLSRRIERVGRDERWARLLEREGIEAFVSRWEGLPLFATQASLSEATRARQRVMRLAHDPQGLARALRVLGLGRMPDYRPRLGEIGVPARLVAGEHDPKFRALCGAMASGWGAPAEATVALRAGHNVVLEHPEAIARLVGGP